MKLLTIALALLYLPFSMSCHSQQAPTSQQQRESLENTDHSPPDTPEDNPAQYGKAKGKTPPIHPVNDSSQFMQITKKIAKKKDALYVFDIDNTLLITNENKFGSDWWYSQTTRNEDLRLNVSSTCLFDVLTPLFYASFSTTEVFNGQAQAIASMGIDGSRTIALTSRGYSPVVANATELELANNNFSFLQSDSATLAHDVIMLNGIIYTKGQNKGEILLDYVRNHSFKDIFYFDDSESKVKDVQQSFTGAGIDISIFHMKIAPKVPYTKKEITYMKAKLCNLINDLNQLKQTSCNCKNPKK